MGRCAFYIGKVRGKETCAVLTECNCFGCKFFKTDKELELSRFKANEILIKKGLRRVKKSKQGFGEYITTEKIKEAEK